MNNQSFYEVRFEKGEHVHLWGYIPEAVYDGSPELYKFLKGECEKAGFEDLTESLLTPEEMAFIFKLRPKHPVNGKLSFYETMDVRVETAFSTIDQQDGVEIKINIYFKDSKPKAFELFDVDTEGGRFHAEGQLVMKGDRLVDYDGVFNLSHSIINKLKELGFKIDL